MPNTSDAASEAAADSAANAVDDAVAITDTVVSDPSCDDVSCSRSHGRKEFPFFKERRDPFFWFNNVCFLIAFGAFVYLPSPSFLTLSVSEIIHPQRPMW